MIISLISNYFEEAKKYDIFLMEVLIMINEKKGIQNGNKMSLPNSQVINTKTRRVILAGMIVYTVFVLYFMFLGFNRTGDKMNYNDYTFIFVPDGVPLRFPKLTMSCLYFFWDYDCF